jgi:hypothetical protein
MMNDNEGYSNSKSKRYTRKCNLCSRMFEGRNAYLRFCQNCRASVRYRFGQLSEPYEILLGNVYRGQ